MHYTPRTSLYPNLNLGSSEQLRLYIAKYNQIQLVALEVVGWESVGV